MITACHPSLCFVHLNDRLLLSLLRLSVVSLLSFGQPIADIFLVTQVEVTPPTALAIAEAGFFSWRYIFPSVPAHG